MSGYFFFFFFSDIYIYSIVYPCGFFGWGSKFRTTDISKFQSCEYSIVLFSNLIFNISEIIWTPKIFNNFSNGWDTDFWNGKIFFFYFSNWTFLDEIEIIKWSNVERPGFRNFKIMNIKITKDELFNFFINEFIFLFLKMKLESLRNLLFFYLENDKVSQI